MSLAKLFVEVGANVRGFQNGMQDVRQEIDRTAKQASGFSNMLSTAIGTATGIAVTKAVSAIGNLIKSTKDLGFEFNALVETSTQAFETMLGSSKAANQFLDQLKDFAKKTPFELPGLIDSAQKLLAFNFTAESIIPTLTTIGDAVAGLGGSPEKLNRVIVAIGQIKSKGKLQAQEMLQLTEAGISAWDMLAKKLGVTIPEAMKMTEKGMISADTAINAVLEGMDKKFAGLMSKQSKSFTGLTSTVKDMFRELAARLTKPWFDNAKRGLEGMIKLMESDKFKAFFESAVKLSEKLANKVAAVKSALWSIAGKGLNLISSLFGSKKDHQTAFSFFDLIPTKISGILSKIKPLGEFVYNLANKGFKALTSVFDSFYRSFNKVSNQRFYFFGDISIDEFARGIKSIFNDIASGGKNLNYWLYTAPKVFQVITRLMLAAKNIFNYFSGEGLQTTLKSLGKILFNLGSTLAKLVRPFKDALGSLFNQLSTMKNLGFADIFKAVLSSISQAFSGFIKVIKDEFWPNIKSALMWVWSALSEFVSNIDWAGVWSTITSVFTGLISFLESIDWSGIWEGIKVGFNAIVGYVTSIDWASVWSSVWSGLTVIGDFLKESVFPALGDFFDWLLSWFLDDSKRQSLYSAVTATWTFITDWASYIWSGISPYLSSFFGYLSSWFTDPSKRQQLWSGIVSTWSFITEWAINLWDWVSPYLGSFFSYLLSWVIDPGKRGQLWAGVTKVWNWITEWGKSLWNWVSPHLTVFWTSLTSWVTNPEKRKQLWDGLVATWNSFSLWASNVWGWSKPYLISMYASLIAWMEETKPGLGKAADSWATELITFSSSAAKQFQVNFPSMKQSIIDLKDVIVEETPKISDAMGRLYTAIFGNGSTGSEFANQITWFFNTITSAIGNVVKQFRILIEILAISVEATKAVFSGDFETYFNKSMEFGSKWEEFMSSVADQWTQFTLDPNQMPNSVKPGLQGHAKGGIANEGRILVGEKGAEVVDLPRGSRVWDHGQSMSKLRESVKQTTSLNLATNKATEIPTSSKTNTSNSKIDVFIHNESKFPIDRQTVKELALALQRELNLQGNRVVFAS